MASGLKITVANDQLVQEDISIDTAGNTVFNSSTREIMINSLQDINKNDMPLLGMPFISSAYLNVNYDTGTFTLWSARATTEQNLIGIGPTSTGCAIGVHNTSTSSPIPTETSTVTSPPSPTPSTQPAPHLSTGAIAGIALGGLAGLVGLGLVTWLCFRRIATRKSKVPRRTGTYYKPELSNSNYEDNPKLRPSYISPPFKSNVPQELPASSFD